MYFTKKGVEKIRPKQRTRKENVPGREEMAERGAEGRSSHQKEKEAQYRLSARGGGLVLWHGLCEVQPGTVLQDHSSPEKGWEQNHPASIEKKKEGGGGQGIRMPGRGKRLSGRRKTTRRTEP